MSADNVITVLADQDGWIVQEHAASCEDFSDVEWLASIFGSCDIYHNRGDALEAAHDLMAQSGVVEYGVCEQHVDLSLADVMDGTTVISICPSCGALLPPSLTASEDPK